MAEQEPSRPDESFKDLRNYVPRDVLDVSFPVAVRGYERHAVDGYVKRVNRLIAEVKVSASPPAAVRHALDQAQEKVEGLLQAARDAADEITSSARRESDEALGRAKADAADLMVNTSAESDRLKAEAQQVLANARAEAEALVAKAQTHANAIVSDATAQAEQTRADAQAEAEERRRKSEAELTALEADAQKRMRAIQGDTDAVWNRRGQLLADVRDMASTLAELANTAASRLSAEKPADAGAPTEPLDPTAASR